MNCTANDDRNTTSDEWLFVAGESSHAKTCCLHNPLDSDLYTFPRRLGPVVAWYHRTKVQSLDKISQS